MNPIIWLGFVAAALAMGLLPGPGVMSIVGYAVGSGRRVALASVGGLAIGNLVAMILSLAGVGALLAASALAFSILKWAGALYLIGLGVRTMLQAGVRADPQDGIGRAIGPRAAFFGNLAIGTFHPKTIVFFVAFAPQFIMADRPYVPQAALLIVTFCGVVAVTDTLYALLAARAAGYLRGPQVSCWSKRVSGAVLIASGVATAATRN
ncbi:MAG TPA: LysE family translocator [Sphingomonas sp.]|uniref:LysE family translocator n=1 Tax=Sphingomonas sp. TaxID=28214 RepID=UPI002ED94545